MVKKTEYIVYVHDPDIRTGRFSEGRYTTRQEAKKYFSHLCEKFTSDKFSIVRKTLTEETICESEDYRQSLFSFVKTIDTQ